MIWPIVVLAILGLIDAIYLTYESFKKDPLVCPLNFDCDVVLKSEYATFLGIKNEYLGLAYYLGVLTLVVLKNFFFSQYSLEVSFILKMYTGFGFLYSIYLTYLQAFKLKNYCFYCLVSASISTLIFIAAIVLK